MGSTASDEDIVPDPLPPVLRENDHFLLHFSDDRQIFAQASSRSPCKINKRSYKTHSLIGLPFGTVLEVTKDHRLIPLSDSEPLIPGAQALNDNDVTDGVSPNDNRHIHDTNTSQTLTQKHVASLLSTSTCGSDIVAALVSNSATFASKTAFSQQKYIRRKQMKYMLRCRIVRVTPESFCAAMHLKDRRKISNLRPDTLGCILTFSNISAGQQLLIMDTAVQGIITASATRRLGGYGTVISLFSGQQPSYIDNLQKMNFTVTERQSLKWVKMGEVFADYHQKAKQTQSLIDGETGEVMDIEKRERESIRWPPPLLPHTRSYIMTELKEEKKIRRFLDRRSARLVRKLTRPSMLELRELVDSSCDRQEDQVLSTNKLCTDDEKKDLSQDLLESYNHNKQLRQCDSLIIATQYDPTVTLLKLLPYLAPSCPFVIFHEFLEPLLETFSALQNYSIASTGSEELDNVDIPMMCRRNIAINLRLTDTWFREYQVLEGRTHPSMTMSQNGGYLLSGIKLCPQTGTNEMDGQTIKMLRAKMGPRRRASKRRGDTDKKGNSLENSNGIKNKREIIDDCEINTLDKKVKSC